MAEVIQERTSIVVAIVTITAAQLRVLAVTIPIKSSGIIRPQEATAVKVEITATEAMEEVTEVSLLVYLCILFYT